MIAPSGTVTFLFTDIVGSTRLWQQKPQAMSIALARHEDLLHDAIETRRGVVFSSAGDSFAAAFWTPGEAIDAALAAQHAFAAEAWPDNLSMLVRMALHTGSAVERNGDYFGATLNHAARLLAAAHGGQTLLSDITRHLVSRDDLQDLGEHQLRDLPTPERIWQVGAGTFPPLSTLRARVGNLPSPRRTFVGRTDDCKRLAGDVTAGQVVTLTGVGGVGKTTLALQVAHSLADELPGGAWWCELAPIEDADGLPVAVAAMLSVNLQSDMSPTAAVVDALRQRSALVVFDNCEHVLDAAASLIDAVIRDCPQVIAIATSREPLGVTSEHVWPVRPLDPDLEGVELFVDRATAADATFVPGDDRRVLVELCRHLDGIPLAIELAAARVRSMGPADLLARLDDRFRLLRRGARAGLERHRTLTATLDWSYSLLGASEQLLFDRLSVFAGSFDLLAVERICSDDHLDPLDVLDLMASLVDKSMVLVVERNSSATRYRLLETIKAYGESHSDERTELAFLRDRHLTHYLTVAERGFAGWLDDFSSGRELLDREWDNLRAATQHAQERADSAMLERLFAAMSWPASYALTYEVGEWAGLATRLTNAGASTYGTAATMAAIVGRFDDAERLASAGIAAAVEPLAPETWMCWTALAQAMSRGGVTQPALEALQAAFQTATAQLGDWGEAFYGAMLALWEFRIDPDIAGRHVSRADAIAAAKQNPLLSADVLFLGGLHQALAGDAPCGLERCRQALAITNDFDLPRNRDAVRNGLAQVALMGGLEDPTSVVRDAVVGSSTERLWFDLWPTIRAYVRWLARQKRFEEATVILGHLDANHLAATTSSVLDHLRSRPGAEEWVRRGAGFDRDQFVAYLLQLLSGR
jgi:predicted ATPase/class 3 adenylate cyclase